MHSSEGLQSIRSEGQRVASDSLFQTLCIIEFEANGTQTERHRPSRDRAEPTQWAVYKVKIKYIFDATTPICSCSSRAVSTKCFYLWACGCLHYVFVCGWWVFALVCFAVFDRLDPLPLMPSPSVLARSFCRSLLAVSCSSLIYICSCSALLLVGLSLWVFVFCICCRVCGLLFCLSVCSPTHPNIKYIVLPCFALLTSYILCIGAIGWLTSFVCLVCGGLLWVAVLVAVLVGLYYGWCLWVVVLVALSLFPW